MVYLEEKKEEGRRWDSRRVIYMENLPPRFRPACLDDSHHIRFLVIQGL